MNTSPPDPSTQLSGLLSRFSPKMVEAANESLLKLRGALPGTFELIYEYNHSIVVAFGVTENGSEAIAALAIYPEWIRLYFQGGKEIPDPKGLLQGSGGKVRFVLLQSPSDIEGPDIRALLEAAIQHCGATIPSSGPTRMIVKSLAKKPKPKAKAKSRPKAKPTQKAKKAKKTVKKAARKKAARTPKKKSRR